MTSQAGARGSGGPRGNIAVEEILGRADLALTLVAGARGINRTFGVPRIQKPGLALTGWPEQLHPERVLVLGATEIDYLEANAHAREAGLATVMAKFNNAERVKQVKVLGDEWLPDSDLLTPTAKLKRRGIHSAFAKEIEAFYER